MKPINYSIHLEPNLETFSFKGRIDIETKTEKSINQVVLNANDLTFQRCKVNKEEQFLDCEFSFDADKQEITIMLPETMKDIIELAIDYTGNINDLLVGFYRSKYEHEGKVKYVAVTQFEERDARRAFPCFDHPAMKATFDIEFVIDEDLKAISNMPIMEERKLDDGKKLVRFERTPPMSTYLVFFGVGDFEFIEDSSKSPLVRVATTPGKTKFADFGLKIARKSLTFGEEYTGVEFPLPKCDYIAVPDFAFGAMENWGATLYRENALLVYPGITSKRGIIGVAMTVAHETAHMWFGDLVTPKEWKYLWLNESFATFFGNNIIVSHYYPEWKMWDRFIADDFVEALGRDSLIETMPIELPGEEEEASIDAASAPIIYAKGGSILRMLVFSFMGEEYFKSGLNHYLSKYSYSNATSDEFWAALEEASGKPVKKFAESWIHQSGYPIIEVKKIDNSLLLKQEEFKLLPHTSDKTWLIPIDILLFLKNGETKKISTIMKERSMSVSIPEDTIAFKLNTEQKSFYRVKYTKEMLNALGKLVKEQRLNPADSFGIENDFYALVRRGDYSLMEYLTFVEEYYEKETRSLPLDSFIGHLRHAYLMSESKREKITSIGKTITENALEVFGFEPKEAETPQDSDTRTLLLWSAFKFGSDKVAEFGAAKFQDILDGREVHADIRSTILRIGAEVSDQAMDYFKKRVMEEETPETEKIMITSALGAFNTKEKVFEALKFAMDNIPRKNKSITINSASGNLAVIEKMWQWFLDNLDEIQDLLHPMHFQRVMNSIAPVSGLLANKEDEVRSTLLNAPFYDKHKDAINMALERMEVNSRFRALN